VVQKTEAAVKNKRKNETWGLRFAIIEGGRRGD